MSKRTITRLFVGSLLGTVAGLVLLSTAAGLAYAHGSLIMKGPDVVGVRSTPFAWSMVALAGLAILVTCAAIVTQFVAWIGALVNTAQLPDKTWFVILLVAGLLSLAFVVMAVYLIAGPPDRPPVGQPAPPPKPLTRAEPLSR